MKCFTKITGLLIVLVASSAQAIPTLLFHGDIGYEAKTGLLSVTSELYDTFDISPQPDLAGTLDFSVKYSSDTFAGGKSYGLFDSISGSDDLTVLDANNNFLLTGSFTGDFYDLLVIGSSGDNFGSISGAIVATGGSLASLFGEAQLIALEFDLNNSDGFSFDEYTYSSDFAGTIDGHVSSTAVPEPALLSMLSLGLLLIGFTNRHSLRHNA